jgi:hypothetical protein
MARPPRSGGPSTDQDQGLSWREKFETCSGWEAKKHYYEFLSLWVNCLLARLAQIGAILPTSQFSDTLGNHHEAAPRG